MLLGGHLDSWDVGTGASDDGVGCIITWEALRLMKKLGSGRVARFASCCGRTKRTACAARQRTPRRHAATAADHVFALESDLGVFAPAALGFSGSMAARADDRQIGLLLAPLDFPEITAGGGGADIGPIAQAGNVPTMAYLGDAARYFVIHHTRGRHRRAHRA